MTAEQELQSITTGHPAAGGPQVRIAFLTDIVTPLEVAMLERLDDMADLRAVFCSRTGTRGMGWELDLSFRYEVVGGLTIPRHARDAVDLYLSPRIVGALHRARPDAVITGGFSIPSVYAALYCRHRQIPLLIHSDGTAGTEATLSLQQRVARRAMLGMAWGAVGNSKPAAERFIQLGFGPDRVFDAPHGVEVEPLWEVSRTRVPSGPGRLKLLSVGRVKARKGIDFLLRAVAQAREAGADVELTVAGTGPDEARLKRMGRDLGLPVQWLGFVDPRELPAIYGAADAFAFPTEADTFGIVLVEAAAAGLPLIASPHGGATLDVVSDGVNGFIIEPSDVAAMAAAMVRLAADPALRAAMGSAGQAATRERTPAACAAGYIRAVETAVAASVR